MPAKDSQRTRKRKTDPEAGLGEPGVRKLRTRKPQDTEKISSVDNDLSTKATKASKNKRLTAADKCKKQDKAGSSRENYDTGNCASHKKTKGTVQPSKQSNVAQTNIENDICAQIYRQKQLSNTPDPSPKIAKPLAERSTNMTHCLLQKSLGMRCNPQQKKSITSPVSELVSQLVLHQSSTSPFDRRCTAVEWHPTNPNLLAVGSKGGDLVLQNIKDEANTTFVKGKGPGGSVQAMKFMPNDLTKLLTASIDGTLTVSDFQDKRSQVLIDTNNCYDYWYCSVDLKARSNLIAAGDNIGDVLLLSLDGEQVFKKRLHKQKVTHIEFSPREDWLLCTASIDKTVQLWDVRMMKDKKSALEILKHDKPVNSAYFSLTDGTRLLTTDQHHELRVYQSGTWHLERTIEHPHRFFQHITPIKAHWHPLQDMIVVGRYPDPNLHCSGKEDQRAIDVLDANSGDMICQLQDSAAPGIMTLAKFNHQGDTLMTSMGSSILIWKRREEVEEMEAELMKSMKTSGGNHGDGDGPSGPRKGRKAPPKGKTTKSKTLSSKIKEKMSNL